MRIAKFPKPMNPARYPSCEGVRVVSSKYCNQLPLRNRAIWVSQVMVMGNGKELEAFSMFCELSSIELVGVTEPSSAKEDTIDSPLA